MDAGGFCEVVSGVDYFVAIPEGDVAGDFAVGDGIEEEESAFSGDLALLLHQFSFSPFPGDDLREAGGTRGKFTVCIDGFPTVSGWEGGSFEKGVVDLVEGGGEADGAGVWLWVIVGGAEFDEAFGGFEAVVFGEIGIAGGRNYVDAWKEDREEEDKSTDAEVHGEGRMARGLFVSRIRKVQRRFRNERFKAETGFAASQRNFPGHLNAAIHECDAARQWIIRKAWPVG